MVQRPGDCRRGFGSRTIAIFLLIAQAAFPVEMLTTQDNPQPAAALRGDKKFGDKCYSSDECGFDGSVCDTITGKCLCKSEFPVTNHLDKCGAAVRVNDSCFFNEQCEFVTPMTECKDGQCACRFEKQPFLQPDGIVECIVIQNAVGPGTYVDPAMIGILVAMFLMFITICVVLRLFSRARWRENRTIFNTPNPRLMNVSLLRENKHPDRRGSRCSVREPSRAPSLSSLRPKSPNSHHGSRRGSRASNESIASTKSPPHSSALLENVTVEVQQPKR